MYRAKFDTFLFDPISWINFEKIGGVLFHQINLTDKKWVHLSNTCFKEHSNLSVSLILWVPINLYKGQNTLHN